ncbi:MAG: hypothetical protein DBY45_05380 [Clostridiales bacterium]|nr:MAG: hypothetical protein DBY45_05380 [Clostridiales bacterium]
MPTCKKTKSPECPGDFVFKKDVEILGRVRTLLRELCYHKKVKKIVVFCNGIKIFSEIGS